MNDHTLRLGIYSQNEDFTAAKAEEAGTKVDVMSPYQWVSFFISVAHIGFWITTEPLWDFTNDFCFSDQW